MCLVYGIFAVMMEFFLLLTWLAMRWHGPLTPGAVALFKFGAAGFCFPIGLSAVVGMLCHAWLAKNPLPTQPSTAFKVMIGRRLPRSPRRLANPIDKLSTKGIYMFKVWHILVVVFGTFMLIGLMLVLAPHLPANVRDRHLEALQAQAEKGAPAETAEAIDQTMACVFDVLHRDRGVPSLLVVWDPCVQQGVMRLRLAGRDDAVKDFRARLAPTAEFLKTKAK